MTLIAIVCLFVIAFGGSHAKPDIYFAGARGDDSYGWPWQFLERTSDTNTPWILWRFPLRAAPGEIRYSVLAGDALAFFILGTSVWLYSQRLLLRPFRFSLAHAGGIVTLFAFALGYYAHHQRQERFEEQVADGEGFVAFEYDYCGPRWFSQLVDDGRLLPNAFTHLTAIVLNEKTDIENARQFAQLRYLRKIYIVTDKLTEEDVCSLFRARESWSVRELHIYDSNDLLHTKPFVSHLALADLHRFPQLEQLTIEQLDDRGLQHIRHCPRLRVLDARLTDVTDDGLPALLDCKKLEDINLYGAPLTQRSIDVFEQLPRLKRLAVGQFSDLQPSDHERVMNGLKRLGIKETFYGDPRLSE